MRNDTSNKENPEKYFNPQKDIILDPKNLQKKYNTAKFYYEVGLKTISEGAVGVIINFSAVQSKLNLEKPKALHIPNWEVEMTLVEFFLNQLKSLGDHAVKEYGKNFSGSREPILVLIQLNEMQADVIESFLTKNRYFGYKGVVTFKTVKYNEKLI